MSHDTCDECGSPGRCRPECSHVAPADAFASFVRGCIADTVENGDSAPSRCGCPCANASYPHPCVLERGHEGRHCQHPWGTPDPHSSCARPSSMSAVDEDRLTRRNPDWLDAKRFR